MLCRPASTRPAYGHQRRVGHAGGGKAQRERLGQARQLEYDIASGKVAEIEPMAQKVAARYSIIRSRLQGIGSKVAPLIAVIKDPEEVKANAYRPRN